MSNERQISADAAMARRLQQEEIAAARGLGGLDRLFRPPERYPDRTPTPDAVRALMDERMSELNRLVHGVGPPGGTARSAPAPAVNGRPRPPAPTAPAPDLAHDPLELDRFMERFFTAGDPQQASSFFSDGPGGNSMLLHTYFRHQPRSRRDPQPQPSRARSPRALQLRGPGTFPEFLLAPRRGAPPHELLPDMLEDMMGLHAATGPGHGGGGAGGGDGGRAPHGQLPGLFRYMLEAMPGFGAGGGATSYEDLIDMIERQGAVSRGATDAEIAELPVQKFREPARPPAAPQRQRRAASGAGPSSAPPAEREKCAICLAEYEPGEDVKRLPCSHIFHDECVSRWLKVNKTCPCCKTSIRPDRRG